MKIKNGRVEKYTDYDEKSRWGKLNKTLIRRFDLGITDVIEIIPKIGVRSKNYEIVILEDEYVIKLLVKTKSTKYKIGIYTGSIENANARFAISHNGKEKVYAIKKSIQIQRCE